jgi:hypothetical protein
MSGSREVCFLIGRGGAILWSDASDSPSAMPDSRSRWEAIWQHRHELEEIAHSHPNGPARFSQEDETTMSALCSALGKAPRFSVVAPTAMIAREVSETGEARDAAVEAEPWWAPLMRLASGMSAPPSHGTAAGDD